MSERQQMLKRPPHILITTPESLYLLLTAEKSRKILKTVRTVIVDEIHAVAPNKRGAHLALSLERLDTLTEKPPVRIGLSATQRPIETVAEFLVGSRAQPTIVNIGHRRKMDLQVEVPKDELGAVATNSIWSDVYDRLASLVHEHRSTLCFPSIRGDLWSASRTISKIDSRRPWGRGRRGPSRRPLPSDPSRRRRTVENGENACSHLDGFTRVGIQPLATWTWCARSDRRGPLQWRFNAWDVPATGSAQCRRAGSSRPRAMN